VPGTAMLAVALVLVITLIVRPSRAKKIRPNGPASHLLILASGSPAGVAPR
jgi:hypothetical protein